ncbi:MAG TPA: response regulator transcription factor [Acidobacteriaceae bacterium]|nr:response regulator transcription factor [Acidobacteriaceae bacterium]
MLADDWAADYDRTDRKIQVLIVDDHLVVRLGLSALLNTQSDLDVIAVAENGPAALALLEERPVDVVLLDLKMPGLSGIETLGLMSENMKARTIAISSNEHDEEIYAAVKAGAQGFVHKEAEAAEILAAVRAVGRGKQAFSTRIRARLANNQMTAGLSSREIEVLHLVALGLTNKEVGRTLNISQFTVRNHLNHIAQKLDASDRTEAIFIAMQTGLISPP